MIFYLLGIIILFFGGFLIWQYFVEISKDTKIIASPQLQIDRLKICKVCDHIRLKNTNYQRCVKCGCFLKPKTRLINQKCPLDKW